MNLIMVRFMDSGNAMKFSFTEIDPIYFSKQSRYLSIY